MANPGPDGDVGEDTSGTPINNPAKGFFGTASGFYASGGKVEDDGSDGRGDCGMAIPAAKEADTIELSFAKKRSRLEQWITAVTGGNQTTNEEEHPPGGPCPDPDAPSSGTSTFIPGDTPTGGIAVNPFQKGPMAGGGQGPDPSPHEK